MVYSVIKSQKGHPDIINETGTTEMDNAQENLEVKTNLSIATFSFALHKIVRLIS